MKLRWFMFVLAALAATYLLTYCVLSFLGGYRFDQSGKVRYGFGLAASDLELWHPRYAWFQDNYTNVQGKLTTRGNALGYFYSPLIILDRTLVHKTVIIDEVVRASQK